MPSSFNHANISSYQRRELRGLSTQWFSSGNQTSRAFTPRALQRVVVSEAVRVGHAVVVGAVDHERGRVHAVANVVRALRRTFGGFSQ